MALFRRAVGEYWIAYYLFYVVIAALGWWLNRNRLQWGQLPRTPEVEGSLAGESDARS